MPTLCIRKRMRTDARLGCSAGPGRTHSLRDAPSCSRAEASNTILHFVVFLSARKTAWCGKYRTFPSSLLKSVTSSAKPFSTYWLIAVVYASAFSGSRFSFLSMLSSRFVAHNCSLVLYGLSSMAIELRSFCH